MDHDVIVIGSGMGGLSAGAVLASEGLDTLIVEQAEFVGGCASSFEVNGFTFDAGACVIQIPRAHDWLFNRLGLDRERYLTFIPNDPTYEWVDVLSGTRFTTPSSLEGTAEVISRFSARDAAAFMGFMQKQGRKLDGVADALFTTPQGRARDLLKTFARNPGILSSMNYILKPYKKLLFDDFEHPMTRRLLTTYSVIGGLPPSLQSSLMLWLCYAEHDGTFYPKGGMGAVPRAVAKAFEDMGGHTKLGARVNKLHMEKGRARGVVMADGNVITSRAVVANNNALPLYLDMVGEDKIPRAVAKGLKSYEFSPSCCIGYLGLDYKPDLKAQHMMALADPDIVDTFMTGLCAKGIAIPQSVGLVSSPSYMDPDLAPPGCSSMAFIVAAPPKPAGTHWQDIKWDFLEKGIETLDAVYLPGVKDHVVFKTIATPEDFENKLSIPNGSIYAFSFSIASHMVFRPSNRSRCVKNLYLCGASTHPGGSVPGSICSGMIAADLALDDIDGRR